MRVDEIAEIFPRSFNLLDPGHISHRTAGRHIGQYNGYALAISFRQLFGTICQDVGRFGHEVNAAKGDIPAIAARSRHLAKLIAIPAQVAQGNYFVLLVVMP
jgi:hypothetical protein